MRNFPQEVIDLVIDMLANFLEEEETPEPRTAGHLISDYSTISRQWLWRTQYHHFKQLHFVGEKALDKWRVAVDALKTPRASQHVRTLIFTNVHTLEGFGDYLRAFTKVETAKFYAGAILASFDDVSLLTSMGSRLVNLEINTLKAPTAVIAWFIGSLPCLCRLRVIRLTSDPYDGPQVSQSIIPFFEGANNLRLWSETGYQPTELDWIPPTARFRSLAVGASCIGNNPGILNRWIASSSDSLKSVEFSLELRPNDAPSGSLDFSGCTSLQLLRLPASVVEAVIPSVSSPGLSHVGLYLDGKDKWLDPKEWEGLEGHLRRLAKRFKAANGGRKMVIDLGVMDNLPLFQHLNNNRPMRGLDKDANVVFVHGRTGGFILRNGRRHIHRFTLST